MVIFGRDEGDTMVGVSAKFKEGGSFSRGVSWRLETGEAVCSSPIFLFLNSKSFSREERS